MLIPVTIEIAFSNFQQALSLADDKIAEALGALQRIDASHVLTLFAQGFFALRQGQYEAAEIAFFNAYQKGLWEAAYHLIESLQNRSRYIDAIAFAEKVLVTHPQAIPVWQQLLALLERCGLQEQSRKALKALTGAWGQRLFGQSPAYGQWLPQLHALELMHSFYNPQVSASVLYRQAKKWQQHFLKPVSPMSQPSSRPRPEQPNTLRIGYLSNEWGGAAIQLGYQGLFAYHQQHKQYRVYAVSASPLPESLLGYFEDVLSLEQAVGLDIIIDLSGWLYAEAWFILSQRPCAVQVLMASNPPFFSGGRFFDALVVDHYVLPASIRSQLNARVVASDCFFHWRPAFDLPQTLLQAQQVAKRAKQKLPDAFQLGATASLNKVNTSTLTMWAQTLILLPADTRLTLKNIDYSDPDLQQIMRERFQAAGGNAEQLFFEDNQKRWDLFSFFQEQHLILDTTPYSGALSTCDAFWSGTPVMGIRDVRGIGVSIRENTGRLDLLADDAHDFALRVERFFDNVQEEVTVNAQQLPEKLAASSICNWQAFGQKMEALYASLWREKTK